MYFERFPSLWADISDGFRNISTAGLTSVSSLFLDHLKSSHSGMMDEVIKLERRQESISGKHFTICS